MANASRSMVARLVRGFGKKAWTRFMDRVGGRLVSGFADTSSDAPDARFEPKRDLYAQMKANERSEDGGNPQDGQ